MSMCRLPVYLYANIQATNLQTTGCLGVTVRHPTLGTATGNPAEKSDFLSVPNWGYPTFNWVYYCRFTVHAKQGLL
jgi:hypothetical protein